MANKSVMAIYLKLAGKIQNKKRTYIIYTKRQHKKIKQNKKKMLTRRTGYVIILLSQGKENEN